MLCFSQMRLTRWRKKRCILQEEGLTSSFAAKPSAALLTCGTQMFCTASEERCGWGYGPVRANLYCQMSWHLKHDRSCLCELSDNGMTLMHKNFVWWAVAQTLQNSTTVKIGWWALERLLGKIQ